MSNAQSRSNVDQIRESQRFPYNYKQHSPKITLDRKQILHRMKECLLEDIHESHLPSTHYK